MKGTDPQGITGPKIPLPDVVTVFEPKEEAAIPGGDPVCVERSRDSSDLAAPSSASPPSSACRLRSSLGASARLARPADLLRPVEPAH